MMPPIEEQMRVFNIPLDLKHDHSDENLERMESGLRSLNLFLVGGHEKCVKQMVLYAEMNIKFLFIQALVDKGANIDKALQLFVANLMEIFLPKKTFEIYEGKKDERMLQTDL